MRITPQELPMKKTQSAVLIALLLSAPSLADAPEGVQPEMVWGTTTMNVKGVIAFDYNPCTHPNVGPQCGDDLANRGKLYVDTTSWNSEAGTNTGRKLTVWTELVSGTQPPESGGFAVLVCSDLNDNHACNGDPNDKDASAWGYSNDGPLPPEACVKDHKDCGDPWAAEVQLCIPEDTDGAFDDVAIFLALWVDAELESNLGAGLSEGNYAVYVDPGAFVSSC